MKRNAGTSSTMLSLEAHRTEKVTQFMELHHMEDRVAAERIVLATGAMNALHTQIISTMRLPFAAVEYRGFDFIWSDGMSSDPTIPFHWVVLDIANLKFSGNTWESEEIRVAGIDEDKRTRFVARATFYLAALGNN